MSHEETEQHTRSTISLQVRNLNVYYGNNHAVKDVSMNVKNRAITALIGPSGCGKSTFLRTINRMNDTIPSAKCTGEIKYDDVDLLNENIDVVALRKEIGMVFQKPNPFPKSIYNNMTHALKFYGIKKKKVLDEIVEQSLRDAALWDEVKDRLDDSALSLSGGQQQRLCVARTLSLKPSVLLLDEPASALDPISNAKIEDLIMTLKEQYTIVIVTHNMQQASRIADDTAFFYQGNLIEFASTSNIFTNPAEERTESYISGKFG
ncbi:MAG TPA: phosphate ABC transporter ATP-binding protein PstB [Bacillales bacterium]|nr:phosphate ABC transporter ATP-binding protein PstB [Bacillales bacterium]